MSLNWCNDCEYFGSICNYHAYLKLEKLRINRQCYYCCPNPYDTIYYSDPYDNIYDSGNMCDVCYNHKLLQLLLLGYESK